MIFQIETDRKLQNMEILIEESDVKTNYEETIKSEMFTFVPDKMIKKDLELGEELLDWVVGLEESSSSLANVSNSVKAASRVKVRGKITSEPPSNVRKSNFFNFSFELFDESMQPIIVEDCKFSRYCDNDEANGVVYRTKLLLADNTKLDQDLVIKVADANTRDLVTFAPSSAAASSLSEQSKVLLVHRTVCSRCSDGRICGNSGDTPTDPQICEDGRTVRVFLKCNQNCLKGPGNPRGTRRFQLVLSTSEEMWASKVCSSQPVFVHNNSKHTKAKSFVKTESDALLPEDPRKCPRVLAVSPSEGWTSGGQTIVVIGDNFRAGLRVVVGGVAVPSQLISPHTVRVLSPASEAAGPVSVSLALEGQQYGLAAPATFTYISASQPDLDTGFRRLSQLVPRYPRDPPRLPREVVLARAADILETVTPAPVNVSVKVEPENKRQKIDEMLLAPWR